MLLVVVVFVGCGDSKVARVTGKVTLDGDPLPNALVTFIPDAGGRPSYGRTNEDGEFELHYTRNEDGAEIGTHQVTITTEREGDPDAEDPEKQKSVKEKIPAKYNRKTELTAEVESGSNEFEFNLESDGKVISQKDLLKNACPCCGTCN